MPSRRTARRLGLLVLLALLGTLLPASASEATGVNVRWLKRPRPAPAAFRVDGSRILDPAGRVFLPHGVARPSLEWSCEGQAADGSSAGIPVSDFTTMRTAWAANSVRLGLSEQSWLSSTGLAVAQPCPGYVRTVTDVVRAARAAGLVVILDLHWSDAGEALSKGAQHCAPDAHSVDFWRSVATRFAADSGVWFELYNEPHDLSWATWRDGGRITCTDGTTYDAVGMQQLADTVRGTGARNIVLAGGLDWGYDLSAVAAAPLHGTNIAYSTHPYVWKGGADSWDHAFGTLSATAPVVATEFGRTSCDAAASYDGALLSYLRAHRVGYTAWAWWAGGCGFPSLLSDAAGTCAAGGCAVQADLLAWRAAG